MSLTLKINGQSRTFERLPSPTNLAEVIGELDLKGDRIAVEHNGQIATRGLWPETFVVSGDRLEVVHFVGGGKPEVAPWIVRGSVTEMPMVLSDRLRGNPECPPAQRQLYIISVIGHTRTTTRA